MRIVLRTHGGLGNQLFQFLYVRLLARELNAVIVEVHDTRYQHKFPRTRDLPAYPAPRFVERLLSALRLPKLRARLLRMGEDPVRVFSTIYVDGYHQSVTSFERFPTKLIEEELARLRRELQIPPAHDHRTLIHLRLGDFFKTRDAAVQHAIGRLRACDQESAIVTNDEALLRDPSVAVVLSEKRCQVLKSRSLSAEEVLRVMSSFKRIDANESTLVFWASVLGGSEARFSHLGLAKTRDKLRACGMFTATTPT